jgi:hypothetical protein
MDVLYALQSSSVYTVNYKAKVRVHTKTGCTKTGRSSVLVGTKIAYLNSIVLSSLSWLGALL